jgi:hypothetical protein
MALELRGNDHYYYEKERDGDKVRSVYAGKGEIAYLLNQMRLLKKDEENAQKQRKNNDNQRQVETEPENIVESFADLARSLTDAFFLTNGFHQHKRQWRKKRAGVNVKNS